MKPFRPPQSYAPPAVARRYFYYGLIIGLALMTLNPGWLTPVAMAAQTNAPSESRYLLIFNTSAAMKRRSENVQRVTGDLIYTGMNGQMRSGDTIGVWTYSDKLQSGQLPLLRWTPEKRGNLAARVSEFLRTQKYEKAADFSVVLSALQHVTTNSTKLTVLVVSDGLSRLSGTPFDAEINAAYEPFSETQKEQRMPFVTVLRVKDRAYLGYAVTPSPWVVEFPKFPPDPVVVAPKIESKPAPPRSTVPPLIVIGKKDTNAPAPVTNTPVVELPQPGSAPKPVAAEPTMTEAEKLFAKLAAEQGVALPPGFAEKSVAVATNHPPTQPTSAPAIQTAPPIATESPKLTPPPPESKPTTSPTSVAPSPVTTDTNPLVAKTKPEPAAPTVATAEKHDRWLFPIAGGASLLVLALGVTYALMRRRQRAHISLITSSMDRRNK